jgi:hypothetical protein
MLSGSYEALRTRTRVIAGYGATDAKRVKEMLAQAFGMGAIPIKVGGILFFEMAIFCLWKD